MKPSATYISQGRMVVELTKIISAREKNKQLAMIFSQIHHDYQQAVKPLVAAAQHRTRERT